VPLNGIGGSGKSEKMCSQERRCKCAHITIFGMLGPKTGCETNSKRIEYGNLFGEKYPKRSPISGLSIITMPLCTIS
jgi:hypothetical protein